jgi:hypothetical protein
MYRVVYYLSGGTRISKEFETISEALRFSVYRVGFGQFHELYKV